MAVFCALLASMYRDHHIDDMKTMKEDVDKLNGVKSKLQRILHVHPDAHALMGELDFELNKLLSWYKAAVEAFEY